MGIGHVEQKDMDSVKRCMQMKTNRIRQRKTWQDYIKKDTKSFSVLQRGRQVKNKKAVLSQGNRAMPQLFFSV